MFFIGYPISDNSSLSSKKPLCRLVEEKRFKLPSSKNVTGLSLSHVVVLCGKFSTSIFISGL